jgi:ribonuclease HII
MKLIYERNLKKSGYDLIAGVDEAGRGPLAGPIVAAAVILSLDGPIPGLADSKLLSAAKRQALFAKIRKKALAVGVARIDHQMIDRINIGKANLLAMKQAVRALPLKPDFILIDGGRYRLNLGIPQQGINGGDRKCASIAAASIIAKVTRDRLMHEYHKEFPKYGFDRHKGYATPRHLRSLQKHGPCAIHRRSFFPVSELEQDQLALEFDFK